MRRPALALVSLAAAMPLCLAAQQPVFKAGVELVRIPVNVTRGDKPVEPGVVTAADFRVTEDGVAQTVTFFQREALPLSVCVVVDASGSMRGSTGEAALAALRQVLTRLLPEDEVSVIAFAGEPMVAAPWMPAPEITRMTAKLETRGATALNDAVLRAFEMIDTATNARPVVLVISDGGENTSRASISQLVKTRRQGETQVYAFNVASPASAQRAMTRGPDGSAFGTSSPPAIDVLPRIIDDSGGVAYRINTGTDAAAAASAFVDDLRFQYTIGYTPLKQPDGKYRRVKVEMNKRGFKIRHRGGYLATASSTP
jgi:VWFA-related protein